jgi:Large polyvalent protein-associated domain 7
MPSETHSRSPNSEPESSPSATSSTPAESRNPEPGPAQKRTRAKAGNRPPPVNAIRPTRHLPRERREPLEPAAIAEAGDAPPGSPASEPKPTPAERPPPRVDQADTDPWTVPQSVRDRFVQDGHRFYFPDGAPAFRDLGHRLTTPSENTQVVHSLVEIARSRGWTEVTVSGTERFRQEAWRQARLAGLAVRGYRPTDPEQAALIRQMATHLARGPGDRQDAVSAEAPVAEPRAPAGAPPQSEAPKERIAGRLLDHGRDAYRHDPTEEMSYFVRIETREGKREIWGKDLERAMTKSLTQPQLGDEVVLQKTGRDVVTVKRADRDAEGHVVGQKEVETHRNRWIIEKTAFFEERARAAQVVRDAALDARTAVRDHPELAGTYLNLKAGELAAQQLRDPEDRRRFVALLRAALADDIERGEPLQPVRLRERARSASLKEREDRTAEAALVR